MAKNNFNLNSFIILIVILILIIIKFPNLVPFIIIILFFIFKTIKKEEKEKFLNFFWIKDLEDLNYIFKANWKNKKNKSVFYKTDKNNYSKKIDLDKKQIQKEIWKDDYNKAKILPKKTINATKKVSNNYKTKHYDTKFKSIWDDYESVIDTMWKK